LEGFLIALENSPHNSTGDFKLPVGIIAADDKGRKKER
jgi:hypothetical protein